MGPDLARDHTEGAFEAATPRRLDQMNDGTGSAPGEKTIVERVGGNAGNGRSVDRLERAGQKIRDDPGNAVHTASAHGIEKLRRKFRKRRADAASGHHDGPAAAEVKGELAQPVEIDLQPGEENEVVSTAVDNLKWTMPVLMVQANVENRLVDERPDGQTGDRLHQVGASP